jgi:hypothetical protein
VNSARTTTPNPAQNIVRKLAQKFVRNAARPLLLAALLALPVAFAQGLYVGATLGTPLESEIEDPTDAFELGAQVGFNFRPGFGVRVAAEGNPFNGGLKLGSGDAIFRFYLPLSPNSVYAGVGADAFFSGQPNSVDDFRDVALVAHALAGLEFRLGHFGLFAEALPSYILGQDFSNRNAYYLRARSGINFHF